MVLSFTREVHPRILPVTVEFKLEWLTVRDITDPTIAELNSAPAAIVPGVPRLQKATTSSTTVAVCKIMIAPLALVHLLLGLPFLTPINTWNLISARAESLGMERRVTPLLH